MPTAYRATSTTSARTEGFASTWKKANSGTWRDFTCWWVVSLKKLLTSYITAQETILLQESTNMFRKFSGLVDLPVSSLLLGRRSRLVVSPYPGIAARAMAEHRSQSTW